jgi:hypothetical protein
MLALAVAQSLAAQSMPLPPPGQLVRGSGSIPESRNGPIFSWERGTVPPVDWQCSTPAGELGNVRIAGRFERVTIEPSAGPVPIWPPYGVARVEAHASHPFAGVYLATYSRDAYGFRLANDGAAFELTVRFQPGGSEARIDVRRFVPGEPDWTEIGQGPCTVRIEPAATDNGR